MVWVAGFEVEDALRPRTPRITPPKGVGQVRGDPYGQERPQRMSKIEACAGIRWGDPNRKLRRSGPFRSRSTASWGDDRAGHHKGVLATRGDGWSHRAQ